MTTKNYLERLDSYNSYSGCDITATVQITSHPGLKDKVYTLGSLQTISISTHQDKRPVRSIGNINAKEYTMGQRTIAGSLVFAVFDKHFADQIFKDSLEASNIGTSTIILPDELPPFDITISYANEYGHASKMRLYGVRLINEGQVMSVNDIYTENTYQFVATGLEPLNKEKLEMSSSDLQSNSLNSSISQTPEKSENDIKRILDFPDYNISFNNKENINLTIKTEQPQTKDDYGIVRFYLSPNQSTGTIKIFPSGSSEEIVYDLEPVKDESYYIMLPMDNYYAYYENDNKLSNTVNFSIYFSTQQYEDTNNIPVIEYVSHDSISILSNNKTHKYAICKEINRNKDNEPSVFIVELKSKKALFKNLKPSSKYVVFTSKNDSILDTSKTESIFIDTLSSEKHNLNRLIKLIATNKNLLEYEIQDYLDLIENKKPSHNIIDFILKLSTENDKEDMMKQELLLFSVKLQNIITASLNRKITIKAPVCDIENPFGNSFKIDSNSFYNNLFRVEKGKNYFEQKIPDKDTYTYIGKSNIKYIVNSITKENTRSCNYEFYYFDFKNKERLNRFADTNKLLKLKNYNRKEISTINYNKNLARHYKKPSIPKLLKPNVYIDTDLNLHIKMSNYNDTIPRMSNLLIAISKVDECLDNTPFIKYSHIQSDQDVIISSDELGIMPNESYVLWIEEIDGTQISYCETIDTYNDEQISLEELEIKNKELEKEIDKIINHLKENMKINDDLSNCIYSVLENEDTHIGNLHQKIIETVIENKIIVRDIMHLIFFILSSKHKLDTIVTDSTTDKVVYNRVNNTLEFLTDKNYENISVTEIDSETGEILKKVEENLNILNIPSSRFVMAYKIKNNMNSKTGFVLIDKASKEALSYGMKVEVI